MRTTSKPTRLTVGRGYRRLKPGERLRKGDEYFSVYFDAWLENFIPKGHGPACAHVAIIYRRRKPKKT